VGIGMTRLAIMDPKSGWQPLFSEDRSVIVVANGEIYNSIELRQSLQSKGHVFRTQSDCETIVHLYEEYGDDCVHHLRGMFAFAIVDALRERLLLVRDRMGEKPLHFVQDDDRLVFCSELLGLVGAGVIQAHLNHDAVIDYFHWGFVPEPTSPLLGAKTVPAGTMVTVNLVSGALSQHRYWSLADSPPILDAPVERISAELEQMGPLLTRSDRPIGVCLSAGIDSSAVALMAQRHATQPIKAISVGYPGNSWQDESALAEHFARKAGIPFHRVELRVEDVIRDFSSVCLHRDEPIADIAGSALFALAGASRELGMPVLLSGLGGDEMFWGYEWIRRSVHASNRARRRREGSAHLLDYLKMYKPPISYVGLLRWLTDCGGLVSGCRQWVEDAKLPHDQLRFWDLSPDFSAATAGLGRIAGEALRDTTTDPCRYFRGPDFWPRVDVSITDLICSTYLRTNGLTQTDRLFMARGVESRVPFVDARLCEIVVGLRKAHPDHDLPPKTWLKQALARSLPPEVMNRRKMGFSPPWRSWIPKLLQANREQVLDGVLVSKGLITRTAADKLIRGVDRLARPLPLAFHVLVLETWIRGLKAVEGTNIAHCSGEPNLPGPPLAIPSDGRNPQGI
jgi:asparagine synthase (glutamine-hydrolysing)